jgi:putative DNA primase/helicase
MPGAAAIGFDSFERRDLATVDAAEAARVSTQQAARIWHRSRLDDLIGVYFRARSIALPVPPGLQLHPELYHRSGTRSPAVVALIRDVAGEPVAVHRTWLAADGSAKASFNPNKMTLGPMSGGAVRLAPVTDTVLLAEGIETTLSAMQLTGLPGWSTLHAPGMKAVQLPASVHAVTIAADHDPPGLEAAQALGERLEAEGRSVTMIRPNREGADFNDVLREVTR